MHAGMYYGTDSHNTAICLVQEQTMLTTAIEYFISFFSFTAEPPAFAAASHQTHESSIIAKCVILF